MKKLLKVIGYAVLLFIVLVGGGLTYIKTALPNVAPAEDITIARTEERIARGSYLANSVCVCMDCHSTRDYAKFSAPLIPGTLGKGGDRFDQSVGMPGVFFPRNITPESLSRYTDGELLRVITTGVTKEGRAMFPLMPFPYYGTMDREDIYSIIAYLRTIDPIKNDVPESVPDFPMNFILNTIPKEAALKDKPPVSDQLAYGAYLVNAGGCVECHTQVEKGQIIKKLAFSGGREFRSPDGAVLRSANITSDPATGIGRWTNEQFVMRFKSFSDSSYVVPSVKPGEFNTVMPWTMYAGMTQEDLTAMFIYLKTIAPISNKVVVFTRAH